MNDISFRTELSSASMSLGVGAEQMGIGAEAGSADISFRLNSGNQLMFESSVSSPIRLEFSNGGGSTDADIYDGTYVVTPRPFEQVLPTQDKLMADDVTVKQIPYFETSNVQGTTVYIGSDI